MFNKKALGLKDPLKNIFTLHRRRFVNNLDLLDEKGEPIKDKTEAIKLVMEKEKKETEQSKSTEVKKEEKEFKPQTDKAKPNDVKDKNKNHNNNGSDDDGIDDTQKHPEKLVSS